jgi:hypothetical protein
MEGFDFSQFKLGFAEFVFLALLWSILLGISLFDTPGEGEARVLMKRTRTAAFIGIPTTLTIGIMAQISPWPAIDLVLAIASVSSIGGWLKWYNTASSNIDMETLRDEFEKYFSALILRKIKTYSTRKEIKVDWLFNECRRTLEGPDQWMLLNSYISVKSPKLLSLLGMEDLVSTVNLTHDKYQELLERLKKNGNIEIDGLENVKYLHQ